MIMILDNYIYEPTIKLVNYVKTLNTPVICFPRNIKDYKKYVEIIKPDVINIDYNVDPKKIKKSTRYSHSRWDGSKIFT